MSPAMKRAEPAATIRAILARCGPGRGGLPRLAYGAAGGATLLIADGMTSRPTINLVQLDSDARGFPTYVRSTMGGSSAQTILKFDLAGLPPIGRISSASFRFTIASAGSGASNLALTVSSFGSGSPAVSLADFSRMTTLVGYAGPIEGTSGDGTYAFDIIDLLGSIAGRFAVLGFEFASSGPDVTVHAPGSRYAPTLAITHQAGVPDPSPRFRAGAAP